MMKNLIRITSLLILVLITSCGEESSKAEKEKEEKNAKSVIDQVNSETDELVANEAQELEQLRLDSIKTVRLADSISWVVAQAGNTIEDYKIYLAKYPKGVHALDASAIALSEPPQLIKDLKASTNGFSVTANFNVLKTPHQLKHVRVNWGDNQTSDIPISDNWGFSESHTYKSMGTYTAEVTAEDEFGRSGSWKTKVNVAVPTAGRIGHYPLNKIDGNLKGDDCYGEDRTSSNKFCLAFNRSDYCGSLGAGGAAAYYVANKKLTLPANWSISYWMASENGGNEAFILGQTGNEYEQHAGAFFVEGGLEHGNAGTRFGKSGHVSFVLYDKNNPSKSLVLTDTKGLAKGTKGNGAVIRERKAWMHFVVTAKSTGGSTTYSLYRDGAKVASKDHSGPNTGNGNAFVFALPETKSIDYSYFRGRLSEVMVYDRCVSDSEIKMLSIP